MNENDWLRQTLRKRFTIRRRSPLVLSKLLDTHDAAADRCLACDYFGHQCKPHQSLFKTPKIYLTSAFHIQEIGLFKLPFFTVLRLIYCCVYFLLEREKHTLAFPDVFTLGS